MREVKEKSPLKERVAETLKSAPQAAFRRGTDASFQQLRQELREAAQDGKSDDRYESGKITDTADHAVQEVRHLAEKAAHRLPKTKSEPQREARTESVPQHVFNAAYSSELIDAVFLHVGGSIVLHTKTETDICESEDKPNGSPENPETDSFRN